METFSRKLAKEGFVVSDSEWDTEVSHVGKKSTVTKSVFSKGEYIVGKDKDGEEELIYSEEFRAFVSGTVLSGTIYRVDEVISPSLFFPYSLVSSYSEYTERLSRKYGEPVLKKFEKSVEVSDFNAILDSGEEITMDMVKGLDKMFEGFGFYGFTKYDNGFNPLSEDVYWDLAEKESGYYCSFFDVKEGYILLVLEVDFDNNGEERYNDYSLELQYLDKKNYAKAEKEYEKYTTLLDEQMMDDL